MPSKGGAASAKNNGGNDKPTVVNRQLPDRLSWQPPVLPQDTNSTSWGGVPASIGLMNTPEVPISAALAGKEEEEMEGNKGYTGGRTSESRAEEVDLGLPRAGPECPSAVTVRARPGLEPLGGVSLRTGVS